VNNAPTGKDLWPEAMAEVTECRYDVRAGRALAFGLPSDKHFRITYHYNAEGELHTGQLYSATALPQGHLFPVRYDPDLPHQHTHAAQQTAPGPRRAMLVLGVVGSLVLSLIWLGVLRGCH
jgi:hypothetical protein